MIKRLFLIALFSAVITLMVAEYLLVYKPKDQIHSKVGMCTTQQYNQDHNYQIQTDLYIKNVWTEGYSNKINYLAEINNNSSENIKDWKIIIELPKNTKLDEFWGAKCEIKDKYLVITPENEDEEINMSSKRSFGFIVSAVRPETIDKYNFYIENKLYNGEA